MNFIFVLEMPLHSSSGQWRLGLALSLLTAFLWGILPLALAIALQVLDAYTVTWFRFSVAFLMLSLYLGNQGKLPDLQKWRLIPWKELAIATIFLAANYLLFLQGLGKTSPTHAEVLIQLAPVLMGLGAIAIFRERYTFIQWSGLGILTLGFTLFFNEQLQALLTAPTEYLWGSSLLIIAAFAWAIYALVQKQLLLKLPSSQIMWFIYGSSALLFFPVASPPDLFKLSFFQFIILLFCGLNTFIAYGAFAESLEYWEASKISAVLALAPIITLVSVEVVAALFPVLLPPEHLTVLAVIGAFLVVTGSVLVALGKARKSLNS